MITRVWHGRTTIQNADRYLHILLNDGTKEYLQTKGNLSVKVWQSKEQDFCHFWTVTEWSDVKAIKSFAGEDYEKAKYYPQDDGILLEFEEKVSHHQTYSISANGIGT